MKDDSHQGCHVDRMESRVERSALEGADRRLLEIDGMGCPTCATRVHNALLGHPGVLAVDVHLESGRAEVWLEGPVSTHALVSAVGAAGDQTNHRYMAREAFAEVDATQPSCH